MSAAKRLGVQYSGNRRARHQRHGPAGRDADGGHVGHRRRVRSGTLPEDIFDGLDSLVDLSLAGNESTTLPEDVFDGLDSHYY